MSLAACGNGAVVIPARFNEEYCRAVLPSVTFGQSLDESRLLNTLIIAMAKTPTISETPREDKSGLDRLNITFLGNR